VLREDRQGVKALQRLTSEAVANLSDAHKTQYVSLLCWRDRAQSQEFSTAIIEPVRATYPKVFG
jgi:hypothetical protein